MPVGMANTNDWLYVQVEKVMRALYMKGLYLWPRFEAHVKGCLKASEEGLDFEVSRWLSRACC